LAIDHRGNEFVVLSPRGEIREITPDGEQSTFVSLTRAGQGFGPLGLAVDHRGDLFAAAARFDAPPVASTRSPPAGPSPKSPTQGGSACRTRWRLRPNGTLYVTDSSGGAVWPIRPGHSAELWLQDPVLAGKGSFGFGVPIGANGIASRHGSLYVLNTELG